MMKSLLTVYNAMFTYAEPLNPPPKIDHGRKEKQALKQVFEDYSSMASRSMTATLFRRDRSLRAGAADAASTSVRCALCCWDQNEGRSSWRAHGEPSAPSLLLLNSSQPWEILRWRATAGAALLRTPLWSWWRGGAAAVWRRETVVGRGQGWQPCHGSWWHPAGTWNYSE